MAQPSVPSARTKLVAAIDRLTTLEARLTTPGTATPSSAVSKVRRDQLQNMWAKVDAEFEACSLALLCEAPEVQQKVQDKYGECYEGYERCVADLIAQIERPELRPPVPQTSQGGCRLPPSDIEVFGADYVRWPTFRGLFTAIYINNPRLSPVEKLYHLSTPTRGDPKAIVEKSLLTNDQRFEAAGQPDMIIIDSW
ncbi:Hypothetical predicted protein [Drosophila guanche]|uniref:Uncharacterized protein n=1 Tax=Drosophila guanche TaxID=7266 RepID=A0A3B0K9E7_DROGU|nr:Hypothetical predicted protein [Drosophila guanche]